MGVTADSVRLRAAANTGSAILAELNRGTAVSVLGRQDGWYKVNYDGKTGYMSADYVTARSSAGDLRCVARVISDGLNLRSGAAASGAVLGVRKGLDVFGVCFLGLTTACGGGMVRDVLLGNTPPAAFQNPTASAVAVVTSLIMFLSGVRHLLMGNQRRYDLFMLLMDSAGLGIFTVMGVRVVWNCVEAPSLYLLVFVGVLTGVGGGLLRDVMAGDMPYIFVKHIYACASLVGAVTCGVLRQPAGEMTAMLVGAAAVFAIRCLSAHYRWNLPHPNA